MSNLPRVVIGLTEREVILSVRYLLDNKISRIADFAIDRGHLVATLQTLLAKALGPDEGEGENA